MPDVPPFLKKWGVGYTFSPNKGASGNRLEFWPAGEPGLVDNPRPKDLPLDAPGVEVIDPKVTPLDILGDVTSHHLVNVDPKVKQVYSTFKNSITPDQKRLLKEQYEYSRQRLGENRPYEKWQETSGLPALMRGYAFKQWPEDFNAKVYTPEQRALLDGMMEYLGR